MYKHHEIFKKAIFLGIGKAFYTEPVKFSWSNFYRNPCFKQKMRRALLIKLIETMPTSYQPKVVQSNNYTQKLLTYSLKL